MDVGTGFYIEKVCTLFQAESEGNREVKGSALTNKRQSTKDARAFYEDKVNGLGSNLKDLESIIQGKANNLRVVEDGKPHLSTE